jgi:hypothetical protein
MGWYDTLTQQDESIIICEHRQALVQWYGQIWPGEFVQMLVSSCARHSAENQRSDMSPLNVIQGWNLIELKLRCTVLRGGLYMALTWNSWWYFITHTLSSRVDFAVPPIHPHHENGTQICPPSLLVKHGLALVKYLFMPSTHSWAIVTPDTYLLHWKVHTSWAWRKHYQAPVL